jgi:hypothetical protein
MLPIANNYTSYTQARDSFVKVLEQLYLLRSPANAKRLFAALEWSQQRLSEPATQTTVEQLRSDMEAELNQKEASSIGWSTTVSCFCKLDITMNE